MAEQTTAHKTDAAGATSGKVSGLPPKVAAKLNDGLKLHKMGDLAAAEKAYEQALGAVPDNPHVLHLLGVIRHQRGEHAHAIELIEQAVERLPQFVDAYVNLGAAYLGLGKIGIAATQFRRAAELDPNSAEAHSNLAFALNQLGSRAEAIESYKAAHRAAPGEPRFVKRLGDLYVEHGALADAAEQFDKFLQMAPDDAEVENNLGYAYEHLGKLDAAETHYRRASELKPDAPDILKNLAGVLARVGKTEEADELLERVLNASPEQWVNLANMATMYVARRDLKRAIDIFEQLIEAKPEDAKLRNDYGVALSLDRRRAAASEQFHKALLIDPKNAEAYSNLGNNKLIMGDRPGAIDALKESIKHNPRMLVSHINLCLAMMHERRFEEAYIYAKATTLLEDYRPANFTNPHKVFRGMCDFEAIEELGDAWENIAQGQIAEQAANFLEMLVVTDTEDQIAQLSELHREWGIHITKRAADQRLPDPVPRRDGGKLRIGLLSSDLKSHSVAKFVRPIIDNYDHERFELHCYTPRDEPDDPVQKRISGQVDAFNSVMNWTDEEIARKIREDGVDILFELNGFTLDSRVSVLAHRPAPVQIYWLGYPFTTGLEDADYILLDQYFTPEKDEWLTETPLLMPDCWVCLTEYPDEPISDPPPFERNGCVTFGTLNNPYKFTREMIGAWAEVMKQVPDSRFLVVRPEVKSIVLCANITKEFERHGIGPERLYFVNNKATTLSYLSFYDEIDISLDTYPLTGGTTTFDALWMGVPVITLVGPNMHQRISHSVLNNLGAGELCTFSREEFIERAVALANDPASMREYRYGIRPVMRQSPLYDGVKFTENLQNLLEEVADRHNLR